MKNWLVLVVLCISCSNAEVDPTQKLENDLLGDWEWLTTHGRGFYESPSTIEYTKRLNFLDNKMAEIYINDTLRSTELYTVYYTSCSTTHLSLQVDDDTFGPVGFKGDSLIFNSSYYDGNIIYYRRLN